MIKIHVDMDKCQHYGQCVYEAPNIFKLNAEDKLEYIATADNSELVNVKEAADVCPMQAITIIE
ncbi:MAG: ferredoxin [Candidatus Nanopelagicaceae bacterium]|jgi:ferredoxin